VANALPPKRKRPERKRPQLDGVIPFINAILEADRKAPRKQRHSSHRIYQRIRAQLPDQSIAESSVRRYVGQRKREMGFVVNETFVPQTYAWGQEAQIDWYEASVDFGSERQNVQVFCMRSMASGSRKLKLKPSQQHVAVMEAGTDVPFSLLQVDSISGQAYSEFRFESVPVGETRSSTETAIPVPSDMRMGRGPVNLALISANLL
jgi:hypothetical protein